jgi:hypothetical protein
MHINVSLNSTIINLYLLLASSHRSEHLKLGRRRNSSQKFHLYIYMPIYTYICLNEIIQMHSVVYYCRQKALWKIILINTLCCLDVYHFNKEMKLNNIIHIFSTRPSQYMQPYLWYFFFKPDMFHPIAASLKLSQHIPSSPNLPNLN